MAAKPKSPSATSASTPTSSAGIPAGRRQRRAQASPSTTTQTIRQIQKVCVFNMHYHGGREAYLDASHRWLMFLVIVFGASAVIDVFPSYPWVKQLLAAAGAVMGALDLAFDLSGRARNHAVTKRRYSDILAACLKDHRQIPNAEASLIELAGEEEPPYQALIALSHNIAETQVYGDDSEHLVVPLHHRLLKNVLRFEGAVYPQIIKHA